MLTERQSRILELVIREYVDSAVPVGSQLIAHKYDLAVSPATVRNEMAELEAEGYLGHPHTSAGRIPTDRGYRFFVEWLMREEELPWEAQQTIRHQFHQVEEGVEGWVRLGASLLAQAVENAAVVTAPRTDACRLKHLELVSLHDQAALLVLVLDQARIRQEIIRVEATASQDELSMMASRLNHLFAGSSLHDMSVRDVELTRDERRVVDALVAVMQGVDEGTLEETYLEGLRHILGQPEFSGSRRVLDLLDILDQRNLPRAIPLRSLAGEGVTVVIGADSPSLAEAGEAIRECSVIVTSYGSAGVASGVVAVLGPMRMRYSLTISTVRYLAGVMSELLAGHYE